VAVNAANVGICTIAIAKEMVWFAQNCVFVRQIVITVKLLRHNYYMMILILQSQKYVKMVTKWCKQLVLKSEVVNY